MTVGLKERMGKYWRRDKFGQKWEERKKGDAEFAKPAQTFGLAFRRRRSSSRSGLFRSALFALLLGIWCSGIDSWRFHD